MTSFVNDFTVQLCSECEGEGTIREIYNFRRMQKTCMQCAGNGAILPERIKNDPSPSHSALNPSSTEWIEPEKKRYENRRKASTKRAIDQINTRLQEYQLELDKLNSHISKESCDQKLIEIRSAFIQHLEKQVKTLQEIRILKFAKLQST